MKVWLAPKGLHIEPGSVGDSGALARLHGEGFHTGWPSSEFAAFLADPDRTPAYVACDKNRRIAGFALFRITDGEAELLTIAVGRRHRGAGIGRALMDAALSDMMMRAVETVFLEVDEANQAAGKLYSRLGFEQVGRRENYYSLADGSRASALVMRYGLG